MRNAVLILTLLLAAAPRAAHAGSDVGVVVTGDTGMRSQVLALVEGWLRAHGHQVMPAPLDPDSTNKLGDCIVLEDMSCARKLVEAQSKSSTVVLVRVEVMANGTAKDVSTTGYWFERGSEPVAEKRTCDRCRDTDLVTTGDELMTALVGSKHMTVGQLHVVSTPAGAHVSIDGSAAGMTPFDGALAPGPHKLVISADGRIDDVRTVTIEKGKPLVVDATLQLPPPPPPPPEHHSSKLPYAVMGAGGALIVAGIVLYATSETDTGEKPEYRDTRPLGLGVSIGGVAVAAFGAYLWLTSEPIADAPTVSFVPGGATVGWGRAF